jgi:hypothetical protein
VEELSNLLHTQLDRIARRVGVQSRCSHGRRDTLIYVAFCGSQERSRGIFLRLPMRAKKPTSQGNTAVLLSPRRLGRQLHTKRIELFEFSRTAAATLPRNSVSPAGRPTSMTSPSGSRTLEPALCTAQSHAAQDVKGCHRTIARSCQSHCDLSGPSRHLIASDWNQNVQIAVFG